MHKVKTAFPFTVDKLMKKSREISNVDYIDDEVVVPLEVLVNALNEESHLHEEGIALMEDKLLRLLSNRLRIERDFAKHPEIEEQEIKSPVLLCGLPRTGTTKLQHILSVTGDFNYTPLWQGTNPALISGSRDEPFQPRIDDADRYWNRFNELSPEAKAGHVFDARIADEDAHIQEHCFTTSTHFAYSEVPSYMAWLVEQDPRCQFEYLKRTLKYLQWQGLQKEGRPWVLKNPLNVGMQPLLREVFPDASLVMTHRDPVEVMASACSLMDSFHKPFTHDKGNYAASVGGFAFAVNQHMENRRNYDLNLIDVHYLDAVKNAKEVVKKIYHHIGMPFTPKTEKSIDDWEKDNPQYKHGAHSYTLEDYGFSKAQLCGQFSDYRDMLGKMFNYRLS